MLQVASSRGWDCLEVIWATWQGGSCPFHLFVYKTSKSKLLENLSRSQQWQSVIVFNKSTMFRLNLDRPTFAIPEVVLKISLHLDMSFGTGTICWIVSKLNNPMMGGHILKKDKTTTAHLKCIQEMNFHVIPLKENIQILFNCLWTTK